jgi:hypothetical protein
MSVISYSLCSVHDYPGQGQSVGIKYAFYEELECVCDQFCAYYMDIFEDI